MTVIKKNQIIVLSLAIMIVAAGYLNYTYKDNNPFSQELTGSVGEKLGDATLVEGETDNIEIGHAEPVSTTLTGENSNPLAENKTNSTAVSNQDGNTQQSSSADQYFSDTRMERERVRDEEVSLHEGVIGNNTTSKEAQEKAQAELTALSQRWEKEMIVESLIKAKGFKDTVVFINEGSVNVVVLSGTKLAPAQVAQIQDIVTREVKVSLDNVKIVAK